MHSKRKAQGPAQQRELVDRGVSHITLNRGVEGSHKRGLEGSHNRRVEGSHNKRGSL